MSKNNGLRPDERAPMCAEDLWKTMSPSLDFSRTSRYGLRTNSSPHSLANVQLQLDIRRNQATFVPELEKSSQIKREDRFRCMSSYKVSKTFLRIAARD